MRGRHGKRYFEDYCAGLLTGFVEEAISDSGGEMFGTKNDKGFM